MNRKAYIEGYEVEYCVMDPTGNVTILVETPVPAASQPFYAAELMKKEPEAEQVGFLTVPKQVSGAENPVSEFRKCQEAYLAVGNGSCGTSGTEQKKEIETGKKDLELRMAGGEFCGNATMSAAVWYAMQCEMTAGTVCVRVSGAEEPVPVRVEMLENGRYRGTVRMPRPVSVENRQLPMPCTEGENDAQITCPVVHFDGIDHVILEQEISHESAERLAPVWCEFLGAEAVGLMFLNRSEGRLTPLVYVPEAGTLVWENSCASGTTAVGAWIALEGGAAEKHRLALREPGGVLTIEVGADGELLLMGVVRQ